MTEPDISQIVLRLSRADVSDPTKRRHFEISIDSPFHILSCQATQHNIFLPAYTSPDQPSCNDPRQYQCGCPGSPVRGSSFGLRGHATSNVPPPDPHSNVSPTNDLSGVNLQRPPAAHLSGDIPPPNDGRESAFTPRPMHIIRVPSYNPPAFDDEDPPPPLETPPPQYDSIASPTTGLADYFARLSDAYSAAETETILSDEDDGIDTPTQRRSLIVDAGGPSVANEGVRNWI
jgi:arrestin-related trafficking adapter 3/6